MTKRTDIQQQVKELLDSLTREELIEELERAGFEVTDGTGKVLFTDDEQEKDDDERDRYFLEHERNGTIDLYERDGTFFDHGTQDLLIATFYEREQAEKVLVWYNQKS